MRSHVSTVELRGDLPRDIVDTLDAVSLANGKSRIGLLNEILHEWATHKRRETMLILNLGADHPRTADTARSAGEGRG